MKLLEETLASTPIARPIPTVESPQGLCLDRGYDYDVVRETRRDATIRCAHPDSRRGDRREGPRPRMARQTVGRRGLPLVAEPQPRDPDPLVQEG